LVLIIDVGLFGQAFWQEIAKNTTQASSHAKEGKLAPTSPSIKSANNNQQLTNDTNYKQLARLYVNHMSLDDKLGQLIVGSFTASGYSPDLDTMINQQHIGGVILY